jgi:hypothetical protein
MPRVAVEVERHGVIQPAAAYRFAVGEQCHLTRCGGLRLVRYEAHLHVHISGRQHRCGLLPVLKHSEERVGVLQLPVLDEERESSEVAGLGDDHGIRSPRVVNSYSRGPFRRRSSLRSPYERTLDRAEATGIIFSG